MEDALDRLLSFWQPTDKEYIPRAIILLLNREEISMEDVTLENRLWNCFPKTLLEGAAVPSNASLYPTDSSVPREDLFTALWGLAYTRSFIDPTYYAYQGSNYSCLQSIGSVLKAVWNAESRFARISVYHRCLEIPDFTMDTRPLTCISEAEFVLLAEYLESCTSEVLPYNAVKTWDRTMLFYLVPQGPIHNTHQLRLANSIHPIFTADNGAELSWGITPKFWGSRSSGQNLSGKIHICPEDAEPMGKFLDRFWYQLRPDQNSMDLDPVARQKIIEAFTDYSEKLRLAGDSPPILARLQDILDSVVVKTLGPDRAPRFGLRLRLW
ncbi:hypothetical protein DFH06DRAFT_1131441 [Mycena polygramma]|nr:hypothetical protein DFH06DRAFT_1131441 [Mycena polygramma]